MKLALKIVFGIIAVGFLAVVVIIRLPSIFDRFKVGYVELPSNHKSKVLPVSINELPLQKDWLMGTDKPLKKERIDKFFASSNTVGFLVMHKDTIVYQQYLDRCGKSEVTQIFSVTKALVVPLLGIAIKEGFIKDIHQKVVDILPDFPRNQNSLKLTLSDLVQMTSGINQDEYGDILSTLAFYFERNINKKIASIQFQYPPGEKFVYKSIDTQILSLCIEHATKKPLYTYFYEKIWSHIGPEDPTFFSLDSREWKNPKYYGGLNTSPRDLAKYASLVMHDGILNGDTIVPPGWLNYCDIPENRKENSLYCLGWWYDMDDTMQNVYYGAGFGGQIMFINESAQTAVIRLGTSKGGVNWYPILKRLSNMYTQN